ncbi:hypothetical protein TNCV_3299581 [Trichonephila clavipes]|uniref:UBL3-like ubiquitin domain-containing protein n=1 Tax=Trichonephila clavipes TaxID=2585209 RepID=A0A8X6VTR9_TRICX|nr:hypothetical protein TNCV_3299581 [Trichonephila clavipes]
MKIQYISREKRCKDAVRLQKSSWSSGAMVWMGISSQGLTKPIFIETKAKIDAKNYQNKVLKPMIKEAEWAEESVAKAEILRLIYQGRFLHGNVTLGVRSNSWDDQHAVPNDPRYARLEANLGISQAKEG